MSKKYTREKRKLFIKISAILLVVCAIVMASYSFMIYNSNYNLSYETARIDCERNIKSTLELFSDEYNSEEFVSYVANRGRVSNDCISSEVRITLKNGNDSVSAETSDFLAVAFQDDKQKTHQGSIDYKKFRESMTDEQYNKIIELFKSKPLVDNLTDYNILVCTEFYSVATQDANIYEIFPKTVQVVTTNDNFDYSQDQIVETFELTPDVNTGELCVCNNVYRNVIDDDFFAGKYAQRGLIKKAESYMTDSNAITENEYLFDTENFTSIYYRSYNISLNGEPNCVFEYAQEFDCLELCKGEIIHNCIVILLFTIIIGVVLWVIMWGSVKSQIKIEEKRRVLTDTMAHNLKSPMFVLSGYAENLKENANPEKREYYADKIIEQTNVMNDIVHKLLEMSKLDSITFKAEKERFNLSDVVEEMVNSYSGLSNGKDIEYTKNGKTEITADKKLIKCVVENMIDNAVKYSPENSTINITLEDDCFSITNTCKNIGNKDLKNIWEPYEKIDSNNGKYSNGLGLSIVRTILEMHKFKYGVKSGKDKITFWFSIK